MARRVYSREELLKAWKEQEEKLKEENEQKAKEEKKNFLTKCCKNCSNSFYRLIPPTGSFTESTEICGCRVKVDFVEPNGTCKHFAPRY